ncbi:MAG: BMP family ABC transporter substrate-binding protein [Pseudomonadota bacterium]
MLKKMSLITVLALGLGVSLLGGCPPPGDDDDDALKAGFIYVGPPGDLGWTYAHDQGRKDAEQAVEGLVTTYIENVTPADAQAKIEELVTAGNDIIFTTSFDFMDPTLAVATAHPDVTFEHCSGYKTATNMSNYFGRMYQARYLTGIVAASMSTTHKIGIAAAVQIPEVIRHINAIALGARSVDPVVELHVRWVHAWYDPTGAEARTQELITDGCDVILQDTDDSTPITAAQTANVYAIGYNSDVASFAPANVLTSAVWNWGLYYAERIKAVRDGTWTSQAYWGGIESGLVGLGTWGAMVPQSVKDLVAQKRTALESGSFDVFDGPFNKQDGSVWKSTGQSLTDEEMLGMSEYVEGVVGTLN